MSSIRKDAMLDSQEKKNQIDACAATTLSSLASQRGIWQATGSRVDGEDKRGPLGDGRQWPTGC